MATTWPKVIPPLTDEQRRISDDYMKFFHDTYRSRSWWAIAKFNHNYAKRSARPGVKTLDVGAGIGEHLEFESPEGQEYVALEMREEMAQAIRDTYPTVEAVTGNVETGLPFADDAFDRVLAIHILEHLPNLPAALDEIKRVLKPGGKFEIVIPCEGGFAYSIGRRFTAQRLFEKRYGVSYEWFIKSEHLSVPSEIVAELDRRFTRERREYWPFKVPLVDFNVCIGLTYVA